MSDLGELYQELILDHQKSPHNFGDLADANHHADGFNPLCGDKVSVDLKMTPEGVIEDIRFKGTGCAISKSSASLMTVALKGKKKTEAEEIFRQFHSLVTGQSDDQGLLGKLKVFQGVREYPARVKCASLAWHTFDAALHDRKETVSSDNEEGS